MHEFRDPESSIVTFVWYRPVPPSKATTAPHCSPGSVFDTCCAHMAAGEGTTMAEKSIHHRPLRDTTAIHLVKAGVDIATIIRWPGHSG